MIKTSANAKFTTPQKHALDSSRNLGVRANAGSGKTSVLVDRIIQILEQNRPADENEFTPGPTPAFSIENIVSITFTKKAAGELKARLMKLLQELELQSVGHVKKWWAKQIEKLEAEIIEIENSISAIELQMVELANQADYAGLKALETSMATEKEKLAATTASWEALI